MKKKLAKILRRWANKLSPTIGPDKINIGLQVETHELKRFQACRHYSRQEIELIEKDPDLAVVIDLDARRKLLTDIAQGMHAAGAIAFRTEAEAIPGSHDVLIATAYAAVKPDQR